MKSTRYAIFFLLTTVFFLSLSCKKEEESTKPSMIGKVQTDVPGYLQKGTTFTASAWGITYPEDITWKWYASSMTTDTLVCNPVTLTAPDSVGQFGLMAGAYNPEFYVSSVTAVFQTIDTASVETFYGPTVSAESFTDLRNGFSYDIVKVDKLYWFAQNLAWDGAGVSYMNSLIMDRYFGRYYSWNEAVTACPDGWRLPTNEDWTALASAVSGKSLTFEDTKNWEGVGEKLTVQAWFLGTQMWEFWPKNQHTNTVGWNGIPAGYAFREVGTFENYGTYAFFWSATESCETQGYYRYVYDVYGEMPGASAPKDDVSMSVRCVRDIEQ